MKRILIAAFLSPLAAFAADKAPAYSPEVVALRSECAAQYSANYKQDAKAKSGDEYHFVYSKSQYKGEQKAGKSLACTEDQYAAYLDKADPAKVMSAYPTAAGRPSVKGAKK